MNLSFVASLRKSLPAFAIFAVLATLPAFAQFQYHLDPASTQVGFSLGDAMHDVKGAFHLTSGDIAFDAQAHTISGQIVVDAGSGQSDSKARDKKMTADQLKASVFPTVTFAPTKFSGTLNASGDSTIQVEGIFTLIGQPHTITVPMTVHIDGSNCTATGSFVVPYVSWGVKDPSVMFLKVAKEVKIDLKLVGSIAK